MALAPDSGSAKSSRELANARKWVYVAKNADGIALWGECQGSGKLPYQTQIDLSDHNPSFKCSCPSRKFPCKHGLGLLLLFAQNSNAFFVKDVPVWVSEWLEKRSKRAEIKAEKAEPKEIDKAAQEKRQKSREKRVSAGLEDLSLWIRDLIRTGLATSQGRPYDFWETAAKRLIDAQASGLARRVRELPQYLSGENWTEKLLEQLALIHLLIEGYKRIDRLPPETQADIRAAIGFTQSQDELNNLPGIQDTWRVYGQVITEEDRLRSRRSYLLGQNTGHTAMLLEFAHAQQPFTHALSGFEAYEGEVVYYPSQYPQRVMLKDGKIRGDTEEKPVQVGTVADILEIYSEALSKNPWTDRIAGQIQASPEPYGKQWTLRDQADRQLKVHPGFAYWYAILEESGGQALHFFGEWDGQTFLPLLCTHPKTQQTLYLQHGVV
jgi:hypothetical protein